MAAPTCSPARTATPASLPAGCVPDLSTRPGCCAGSKSWCHFAQQYERPAWSVGEGLGLGGGDARSETYSYVVLR
jgi:hypothetical protein